jgi:hypothetical protein
MKKKETLKQKKVKSGVDKLSTKSKYATKIRSGRTANSPFNGGGKTSGDKFVRGINFFKSINEEE